MKHPSRLIPGLKPAALLLAGLGLVFAIARAKAPVAEKVPITFTGVTKFRPNQLREALADQVQEINDSGLTPASADDAAFFLGLFYHNHGYSQADVKWKIDG
ncbi:MAG TPA: hypothetical protein VG733_02530, partial [Chthoniobacteraceae bacterium]|nr:hypothetical protein [Chthoniobacteraceae bacterium]